MLFSRFASAVMATALFTASTSAITIPINIPGGSLLGTDLDLGLFNNGSVVNVDAFANVLSDALCPTAATLGVTTAINILGVKLLGVCACVNALSLVNNIFQLQSTCPPCPANSQAICANGQCGCACAAGFFADPSGICVPVGTCVSPNVIVNNPDGTSFCQCNSPFVAGPSGTCVMQTTMRARSMHRKTKKSIAHPHAARAGQEVLTAPSLKAIDPKSETCPDGETACRLSTGGFECIDTTNALNSCGGCVGEGLSGQNCLAIPGALNVQCEDSACKVSSCFKGWSFKGGKCV